MSARHDLALKDVENMRARLVTMELDYPHAQKSTLADTYGKVLDAVKRSIEMHEIIERRKAEMRPTDDE